MANISRYDPGQEAWTVTETNGARPACYRHTAVWTGSEMIVWGGTGGGNYFNAGGRYNPGANMWIATATSTFSPTGGAARRGGPNSYCSRT